MFCVRIKPFRLSLIFGKGVSKNYFIISGVQQREVCHLSMTTVITARTTAQAIRIWTLSVLRMKQRPFSTGNSQRIQPGPGKIT